jgi:signal transduction histidine kinase
MKLSNRLLIPLLPAVAGVMVIYAAWAVRHRQETLLTQAQLETRAYATALSFALEYAFREGKLDEVQEIINEISRQPMIYGILVYDADGNPLFVSEPLGLANAFLSDSLQRVLAGAEMVELERRIDEDDVYSVLRPIRDPAGRVAGILEVAQPLAFVRAEISRVGRRFLLNTLTLLIVLTALILWLVRHSISRPLERFLAAIRALGRGELSHRVSEDPGGEELEQLAREFNRMATQLEMAHSQLLHETEERVALERRLRQSEHLAAVGNLAAGVAHQIAAPLNVIGGRTQKLLRREARDPVEERNLRIISEQIDRITAIVRNLLDLSRHPPATRLELVNVTAVLDDVIELLDGEFASRRATLDWERGEDSWVTGDCDLLHQVFVNLLINALQALEYVDGARRVEIRIRPDHPWLIVEIRDSGHGIAEDVQQRIFEPFFTTKAQGTGLGLSMARSIVRGLDGRLEAENDPAGGAVLRVLLRSAPRSEPASV